MFKCRKCQVEIEKVRSVKLNEYETILLCPVCNQRIVSESVEGDKKVERPVQLLEG